MMDSEPTPFSAPKVESVPRLPQELESDDPELLGAEMLFDQMRKIFLVIAVLYAVSGVLAFADQGVPGLILSLIIAGVHVVLWAISRRAPLAMMIVASVLFAIPILLNPRALISIINVAIIVGLVRGVMLASRLHRVRARLRAAQ